MTRKYLLNKFLTQNPSVDDRQLEFFTRALFEVDEDDDFIYQTYEEVIKGQNLLEETTY